MGYHLHAEFRRQGDTGLQGHRVIRRKTEMKALGDGGEDQHRLDTRERFTLETAVEAEGKRALALQGADCQGFF